MNEVQKKPRVLLGFTIYRRGLKLVINCLAMSFKYWNASGRSERVLCLSANSLLIILVKWVILSITQVLEKYKN